MPKSIPTRAREDFLAVLPWTAASLPLTDRQMRRCITRAALLRPRFSRDKRRRLRPPHSVFWSDSLKLPGQHSERPFPPRMWLRLPDSRRREWRLLPSPPARIRWKNRRSEFGRSRRPRKLDVDADFAAFLPCLCVRAGKSTHGAVDRLWNAGWGGLRDERRGV